MTLKEILKLISTIAEREKLGTPYIVGGIPRNILLNELDSMNDIDITTGNKNIHVLADKFAEVLKLEPKILKDGHRQIYVGSHTVDFSSYEVYDKIDDILMKKGIMNPSDLMRETFSRDFTINTLLMPLDFSKIIDLTGVGKKDIRDKILRCPISCDISLTLSPNRIIRAFYYSAKFGLKISDRVKEFIKNNLNLLKEIDTKYSTDKIGQALKLDISIIDELLETGILQRLPLTKDMTNTLIEKKRLNEVL